MSVSDPEGRVRCYRAGGAPATGPACGAIRAAKRRRLPCARRVARSIANPAASTVRSVSRLGRQPPGKPGPGGLDQILDARAPRALGPDVLEHPEGPSGAEHASHLPETGAWVVDATEHETAHHRVERGRAKGQRLGPGLDEPRAGRAPAGASKGIERGISAD